MDYRDPMISVVYSGGTTDAYRTDLVTYATTEWQYSKDNLFSITRRQGHKSVLTIYTGFDYYIIQYI